jgi:hypothetical protein
MTLVAVSKKLSKFDPKTFLSTISTTSFRDAIPKTRLPRHDERKDRWGYVDGCR